MQERERGDPPKLQGKRQRLDAEWVWDISCCFQRVRLCQGPRSHHTNLGSWGWFYPILPLAEWTLQRRGRGDQSKAREHWGCEGFSAVEGSWPCRSHLCPARAVTRSTPGGSSRGLCSHWSLRSQIFHNAPFRCRKAQQGCESTWYWERSKWKQWFPGKCLSDLTVTSWDIWRTPSTRNLLCAKLQLAQKRLPANLRDL